MGVIGRLVKTRLGLLTIGILLVIAVPPLGRLVLYLLGAVVLVAVAAAVLTLLVILNDAVRGADRTRNARGRRSDQHRQRLRPVRDGELDSAHRDLDVGTIDDYRR